MTDSLFENITIDSNSDYVIDLGADSSNISSNVTFKDINITGFSNISIFINNSEEINFSRINITGANLDYLLYNSTIYNYDFSENSLVINNSYGAVEFINSSLVASGSNLSEVIQITDNNVFINSTKDIGFNTTANITLNDLITPVVAESIVDYFDNGTFVDCPANLCMDISWDNVTNVYKFNVTHFTTYSSEEFNTIPNTPQPFLNTSSGANISSENLICDILIDDPDGDALNVTVNWYLNDSFNLSVNYSSQTNGTNLLAILESGNTTRYENWTCEARFTDEQDTTPYANSSSLSVLNQLPVITLLSPANVSSTINRTPEFNWSVVDADSDVSHYQINITDYKFSGSQICSDSLLELLTGTSFVPTVDLLCLHDNGYYYTWRVRANDSVGFGAWSEDFIVNITADTTITLVTDSMNFGLLAPSGSNDTTNENPSPFVIRNDGTVMTNISINASALWTTQSENSSSFQFKVDNVSSEPNSFNWINSIIQFFNVPITGDVVAISELNYTDSSDSAEIDISILVPSNEGPGAKSSTIIFTSRLAEIG
ncbi:MAG: hypothetical protein IH845_03245 [Nanoarchaeota archaeon]|nr:hypothetical protein [Nanoarchaeota archaeon]